MFHRTWFPTLCALFIVFGVYWFAIRDSGPKAAPSAASILDPYNRTGQSAQPGVSNSLMKPPVDAPNLPTSDINNIMHNITSATLHTSLGDITIAFNPATPNTVANFVKLAEAGFYNGTKFHRIIAGFMNQGGDPLTKDDSKAGLWGTGGPGYQFADEIGVDNHNVAGTISMANAGPNTNGSQFFINAADNTFLDTKHTVFGRVTEGLDVAMKMNQVKTDGSDRPLTPVVITSITLK
ncbi:MAG TPA: peptidylprolyl isomerase [Candidatus Paceibacterota bacterium]|jgi:cyclophilin family peptidyl-prolyl cis-trans isomerase|nr:peptidylprolyl isomerase [Candidatus Paceibacterota bacterium]